MKEIKKELEDMTLREADYKMAEGEIPRGMLKGKDDKVYLVIGYVEE